MLSIERITGSKRAIRYRVVDIGRDRATVAVVDGLERAGCLLRFLKGSQLHPSEYELAVDTMRAVDAEDASRIAEKGGVSDGKAEQ